jgi:hypothetical protein
LTTNFQLTVNNQQETTKEMVSSHNRMETAQDWLENQAMANTPADPDFPLSLYQLVRIRSPNGTHRYDISPTDDLDKLIAKVIHYSHS